METIGALITYKNRKQRIWFDTYVFDDLQPMSSDQAQQLFDGWIQNEWKVAKEVSPQKFAEMITCQIIRLGFSKTDKKHQLNHIRLALSFITGYFHCQHIVIRSCGGAFMLGGVVRQVPLQYVLDWQQAITDHRLQNGDDADLWDALCHVLDQ